jgi:hypothetical protein
MTQNPLKRPADPAILMDERDATRCKLPTLPIDNDTHDRWVAAVFEACDDEPSSFSRAAFFLATIVLISEELLNAKYKENLLAKALLQEDFELMEKLGVAWRDKTLWEILDWRTFAFCCLCSVKRTSSSCTAD